MDAFKHLVIEYPGIESVITSYSSDGNIGNYVEKLGEAIRALDLETIRYTLTAIDKWYNANMNRILSNVYVGESGWDEHRSTRALIKEFIEELRDYQFPPKVLAAAKKQEKKSNEKIIFLSHKSSDKKYADALRNFIIGLGVKNDQLIYTSHPLHKIPLDQNIYEYLRKNLGANVFMIILWSNQYLESPACLNEMGAAWLAQSDYTNIYVPTFSFGNPKYHECAVDTRKMGAVLNGDQHCKASMLEFKDKIEAMFELKNDEKQVTYLLDQFLKEIGD